MNGNFGFEPGFVARKYRLVIHRFTPAPNLEVTETAIKNFFDSPIIDLIILGDIDQAYLIRLINRVEPLIKRKVRYLIYQTVEFTDALIDSLDVEPVLLWSK